MNVANTHQHAIDRRWARFSDPATEARYEASALEQDRHTIVFGGALGAIGLMFKAIAHAGVYPDAATEGGIIHGGAVILLVAVTVGARMGASREFLERYMQVVMIAITAGFAGLDVYSHALDVQYAAVVGLIAAFVVWVPMSFGRVATVCLLLFFVHLGIVNLAPVDKGFMPMMVQMMATVLLLLLPARHSRETSRREGFAQHEVIEEKTRQYHGLLLQVLPQPIAARLQAGERDIADLFDDATVLFADIVGFSRWSKGQAPGDVLGLLRDLFGRFDELAKEHGLEKIKTIGDAYMVAGGVPNSEPNHCRNVANFALDMVAATADFEALDGSPLLLRVGVHTGPLVGGVTGQLRFIYDLWGDTVNTASRMESHGVPGRIQVSQTVFEALPDGFLFEERGVVEVKGRGPMRTFWLIDRTEPMAG